MSIDSIKTQAAGKGVYNRGLALYYSNAVTFTSVEPGESAFTMKELGIFGKVGSLEPGYEFDALVIRDFSDPFRKITPEETVERFCYTGNSADILARFIHGEKA